MIQDSQLTFRVSTSFLRIASNNIVCTNLKLVLPSFRFLSIICIALVSTLLDSILSLQLFTNDVGRVVVHISM